MSEYIRFELLRKLPKTLHYTVFNISSDDILGWIKWNNGWRQYCFYPLHSTFFSGGCMEYIVDFIQKLMKERIEV